MNADPGSPEISVVVAAFSGEQALYECIAALQVQTVPAEIIVASGVGSDAIHRYRLKFPDVYFVQGRPGASVFELRSLGIAQASGRLIVLTEDHCIAGPEWLEAYAKASRGVLGVMGGPVENGRIRGVFNWALYLCEYGVHMPSASGTTGGMGSALTARGEQESILSAETLSGVNIAYRRDLLMSSRNIWQTEFRENEVHDALLAGGHALHRVESAGVTSHLAFTLSQATAHLMRGGFHYGGYRTRNAPMPLRILRAISGPIVPFVLLMRIVRCVAGRQPRRLWQLTWAMPYLLCLLTAWSAGEAAGCLRAAPTVDATVQTDGA